MSVLLKYYRGSGASNYFRGLFFDEIKMLKSFELHLQPESQADKARHRKPKPVAPTCPKRTQTAGVLNRLIYLN